MSSTLIPHYDHWQPVVEQHDKADNAALMDAMFSAAPSSGPRAGQTGSNPACTARQAQARQMRLSLQNNCTQSQQSLQAEQTTQFQTQDTATQRNFLTGAADQETRFEAGLMDGLLQEGDAQAAQDVSSLQQIANAFFTLNADTAEGHAVEQSRRALRERDRERIRRGTATVAPVLVRVPAKEGAARS